MLEYSGQPFLILPFLPSKGNDLVIAVSPKCEIPHHDRHQSLVPPSLGLLQAVESFVWIVHEDFAEWAGDGRSRRCNHVVGEYFVQICALDVDLTNPVDLGSCNRKHSANRRKACVWREDVERRDKSIFAACQTCCGILRHPEICFEPTTSALSDMSVIFHIPAPFSVADSSTIAFSRNNPSSPDSAPARF